jgi:hypothetical protein
MNEFLGRQTSNGEDLGRFAGRSTMDARLAQITSRLLDQLATYGEPPERNRTVRTGNAHNAGHGGSALSDDSQLVAWRRVVAVSARGNLPVLVSLPFRADDPSLGPQASV